MKEITNKMKQKLLIQSLSPLALLTIIRNFMFVIVDIDGNKLKIKEFLCQNIVLLIVMIFCFIWLILSIWFYIEFKAFQYTDRKRGFSIKIIEENDEAGLNFLLTLILPLVIDDVNSWQGASVFFILLFMICILLSKTRLFYANPILSILGYKILKIKFDENNDFGQAEVIALSKGVIDTTISYREITPNVIYIKGE